jgi:hypothetical protein
VAWRRNPSEELYFIVLYYNSQFQIGVMHNYFICVCHSK